MEALRIGIIGAGWMGRAHLAAFAANSKARPVWIADVDAGLAARVAAEHSLSRHSSDYRRLLNEVPVDSVSICIPTFLHAEAVEAAAAAGAHIVLEKPIALTLADADRIIVAAERAGVKLMIAFYRRFDQGHLAARDLITSGRLGEPVTWHSAHIGGARKGRAWVLDPDKGGGYLLEAGIHHLDFALWTWGEPKAICAVVDRMAPGTRVPDTLHAVLSFAGGHRMVLNWCYGGPAGMGLLHMTEWVIGPKGLAQVDPVPGPLRHYPMDGEPQELAVGGPDAYQNEIDHFVECIGTGRTPSVSGVDGRRALELHLAILRAGEGNNASRPGSA